MSAALDQRRRARAALLQGPFTPEQEERLRGLVREEIVADREERSRENREKTRRAREAWLEKVGARRPAGQDVR